MVVQLKTVQQVACVRCHRQRTLPAMVLNPNRECPACYQRRADLTERANLLAAQLNGEGVPQ